MFSNQPMNKTFVLLGDLQSHDLIDHPAVQALSRAIDMQNACGYITLLNPHLTSRTETDVEDNASLFKFVGDSRSEDLMQLNGQADETELALGSEEGEDCNETLMAKNGDRGKNYEDWCLLDMHFGLPLFDAKLNQEISLKVFRTRNKHIEMIE